MKKNRITSLKVGAPYGRLISLHYLPAMVAIFAMVGILIYADWQNQTRARADKRADVYERLLVVRTGLENTINANVQRVIGLVGVLETEPAMTQQRFDTLATRVLGENSPFLNIAAAPDMVVRMVHPYEPNRSVLGLDYNKNDKQRAAALEVRDRNEIIVTGPVSLVQGGEGLVARFPVNVDDPAGQSRFWGIVSAAMDLNGLYRQSGLLNLPDDLDVTIAAVAKGQGTGKVFFGASSLQDSDPVRMKIQIGHQYWILSGAPKQGWDPTFQEIWMFRLALLAGEFLIILPMVWAGRLMFERQRNMLELKQRDQQMESLSQRLQMALKTSKIGIWEYDIASGSLIWDERMRDLYGVAHDKVVGTCEDWERMLYQGDLGRFRREFAEMIETSEEYKSEFRVRRADGAVRHIRAIGTSYKDPHGRQKLVGVNWDVTADIRLQADLRNAKLRADAQNAELEKARQRMESAALHDALTGLPNRRYLDQLMAEMAADAGSQPPVTVMHVDLDRFKFINDTLGHAAGDMVLRHAARSLQENIGDGDFLARIGGDEFVIVARGASAEQDSSRIAAAVVEAISKPVYYEGHECRVGASIGIARRENGEPLEEVLINADIALYEAKRHGRNRVEKFTDALRQVAVNTKKTTDEILRGLESNEFVAYFQPQFDAESLEVVGLEALARWDHPSRGILAPSEFLRIAENLKVVAAIDEVILRQALMQQIRLDANGLRIPRMSVNISAQRLRDETLIEQLKDVSFASGRLSFELLESTSFDTDDGQMAARIDQIRELGIDIEIDDFGTGYASIVTLLKLTPRRLKIDRQLIAPVVESVDQRILVRSIIDIGRSRGIEIVAEGVETMAHVEILRDLGCHVLQGYALARPMSPSDLLPFLKARSSKQRAPMSEAV